MRYLPSVAAALAAGAAAVLFATTFPKTARRRRGAPVDAVVILASVSGLLTRAAPTGTLAVDLVMVAGIGAMAAWAAARAPHRMLAATGVVLTPLLDFSAWVGAGAGVALAVVLLRHRMPALKASAGALIGAGLLLEIGPRGPSWREGAALVVLVSIAGISAGRSSSTSRRVFGLALSAGLAVVVVAGAGFLAFAIPAERDLARAANLSENAAGVLTTSRSEGARASLALAASAFGDARTRLARWPARIIDMIPVAAQNAAALRAVALAGEQVAAAASVAATGPADLRVGGGGVDLAALDDATVAVRRARVSVVDAIRDLTAARSRSLLPPVSDGTEELRGQLVRAAPTLAVIERSLEALSPMLGSSRPRRYLLALQTPAEARAAGGVMGSFGVLEANQGRLQLTRTGNADELNRGGDPAARAVQGAEEFTARYGRFLPLQIWQNLSLTPDWPTLGHVAGQLFPQSGGQPIDGVIGLDPFALAGVLSTTGPLDVPPWPVPITAENATSVLMHEQYLFFPNPERREFVADVTAAAFERLNGDGVSLRALVLGLAESAKRRNLQLWSADEAEQDLFADLDMSGEFPPQRESSDLLSVVTQNSSGSKIDWFLHRSMSYDVTFDPTLGRLDATLRVSLRNDAPSSGLPAYVIGSAGPVASRSELGENRTWLSVYSPLGLQGATLDGQPLEMERGQELQHNVYSAFILVPPSATVAVELKLNGLVDPDKSAYHLHLRHQVLPNPETVAVSARFTDGWRSRGSTREERELLRDERLAFRFEATRD